MNGAFAAALLMTGMSVAQAQEDTLPVRQNVYPNQVSTYPGYPAGGYYPAYPPVGYPGVYPGSYPGSYPGGYPGGYPGAYPGQQGASFNAQGQAGQSIIRDPASGQMLTAPNGSGSNVVVDPSVYMRGQTPNKRGPQVPPGSGLGGQGPARKEMVRKTARTAGIRDGYAQEAERINGSLNKMAGWLDRTYPFPSLMINQHIVPPVVVLTNNRVEKNGPQVLELTLGRFEIATSARLTAQAPSWRTYLFMQSDPDSGVDLRPRTKEDGTAWNSGYSEGQSVGIAEARAYFEEAERRMRRDFEGMARYHDLAARGAISMPIASQKSRALQISRDGRVALRGSQTIKIVVNPTFGSKAGADAFPVGSADVTMRNVPVPVAKGK
jgi:defect-in-organelle-trafficking protein DotC